MNWLGRRMLVIGTGEVAAQVVEHMKKAHHKNDVVGCLRLSEMHPVLVDADMCVGTYDNLKQMVDCLSVSVLLIADYQLPNSEVLKLLSKPCFSNLTIVQCLPPAVEGYWNCPVSAYGELRYCLLTSHPMGLGLRLFKRGFDVLVSALALLLLSPLMLLLCLLIGRHPIYKQERIGRRGKRFAIYKLRTMCVNAEKKGPQLSSEADERITKIGRFLRKYRIDEFPQFYNVLCGDMSLIGPRPERWFYFKQITAVEPEAFLLLNIRPGITSMGMVKYGYASSVEMMLTRLQYDKVYYQHATWCTELAVFVKTIKTILKGRGV